MTVYWERCSFVWSIYRKIITNSGPQPADFSVFLFTVAILLNHFQLRTLYAILYFLSLSCSRHLFSMKKLWWTSIVCSIPSQQQAADYLVNIVKQLRVQMCPSRVDEDLKTKSWNTCGRKLDSKLFPSTMLTFWSDNMLMHSLSGQNIKILLLEGLETRFWIRTSLRKEVML